MTNKIKFFFRYTAFSTEKIDSSSINEVGEPAGLSVRFLGVYSGTQESYHLRNENGVEIEINGEMVTVPSCDYKFIIQLNNRVSVKQINLNNQQRISYEGTYQVVDEDENTISISCAVSDNNGSSPNYTLQINKADKSAVCFSNSEPEFTLTYGSEKKEPFSSSAANSNPSDTASHQESVDVSQDSAANNWVDVGRCYFVE